ncbi:MFS transporter [Streptomyces sp. AP-93]|nr:MFS transporter [Streptomyces sp. AP-93]
MSTSTLNKALPERGNPRLFAFVSLVNSAGRGAFLTCSALYFTHIVGLSLWELGVGLTIAGVAGLFAGVPFGYLADRRGPRETASALLALSAVTSVSFMFVSSFVAFVAASCLFALLERGGSAARQATLAAVLEKSQAVTTRAYLRAVANIGMAVGTGLAGIALALDSRPYYIAVLAFNSVALAVCSLLMLRLPKTGVIPPKRVDEPRLVVLRDRPYATVALINFVMMLQFQILDIALPLWVARHTTAPRSIIAALILFNTVAVVLLQVRVSKKIGDIASAVRWWRISGFILFGACFLFSLSANGSPLFACVMLALAAILHVYAELLQSAASWVFSFDLAPEGRHGQYQGFFNTGLSFSDMVAPVVLIPLAVEGGSLGWLALGAIFIGAGLAAAPAVRWAVNSREAAAGIQNVAV